MCACTLGWCFSSHHIAAFRPWISFISLPPWVSLSGWLSAIHPSGPSSRVAVYPTISPLLALIPHVCLIFSVLLSEGCGSRDLSFLLSVTLAEPSTVLGIHSFAKWMNRWPVRPMSGHSLIHFLTCKSKCLLYLHHRISLRAKYSDEHLFKEYKRLYKAVKWWLNVLCASSGNISDI